MTTTRKLYLRNLLDTLIKKGLISADIEELSAVLAEEYSIYIQHPNEGTLVASESQLKTEPQNDYPNGMFS